MNKNLVNQIVKYNIQKITLHFKKKKKIISNKSAECRPHSSSNSCYPIQCIQTDCMELSKFNSDIYIYIYQLPTHRSFLFLKVLNILKPA